MKGKRKYLGISTRAKLLLQKEEGFDVDFKKNSEINVEDLVAFANSTNGGTILLGIDEQEDNNGIQSGVIIGCKVNDISKMKIVGKANQCIPHIDISIHIENSNKTPFYRIEIPSSPKKPHCTQKGIYKTRGDGANKPILPQELLRIYLNSESENFLKKYSEATTEMRDEFKTQHKEQLDLMWDNALELEENIERSVGGIETLLDDVYMQIDDSQSEIQSLVDEVKVETYQLKQDLDVTYDVKYKLKEVDNNIISLAWKLNSLLDHFNLEDPEITNSRENLKLLVQWSKKTFDEHTVENKLSEKKIREHLEKLYKMSNSTIRNNYSVDDLVDWYYERTE